MNFGGKVESGRQKREMEASVALGDGDLQNIPSGVHNMRTVLDATSDAEATQEQALGIDRREVIVSTCNEARIIAKNAFVGLRPNRLTRKITMVHVGAKEECCEESTACRALLVFSPDAYKLGRDSLLGIAAQHDKNRAKGRAMLAGINYRTCIHVIVQHGDLAFVISWYCNAMASHAIGPSRYRLLRRLSVPSDVH